MGLALVVVEEDARRAVHLRDDHALGAVDDERAVRRHERHLAHIDFLLLDVLDGLGAGVLVGIEHDEAQRHLQGRGEGHAALAALVDVIFRRVEIVADEFEQRGVREIGNREDGLEDRLQALVRTAAFGLVDEQELIVRGLLHLDEVRHLGDIADRAEELAHALTTGESLDRVQGGHGHSSYARKTTVRKTGEPLFGILDNGPRGTCFIDGGPAPRTGPAVSFVLGPAVQG